MATNTPTPSSILGGRLLLALALSLVSACDDGDGGAPGVTIELDDVHSPGDSPGLDAALGDTAEDPGGLAPRGDTGGPDARAPDAGPRGGDTLSEPGDARAPEPDASPRADGADEDASGGDTDAEPAPPDADPVRGDAEGDGGRSPDADEPEPDTGEPVPNPWAGARCGQTPPAGVTLAAEPKPYTGGVCPALHFDGVTHNVIVSGGEERKFLIAAPSDVEDGEQLPVLFAWHWLKGSAKSFVNTGELIDAAQEQRFVAIIPESLKDLSIQIPFVSGTFDFPWPFSLLDPEARFEKEHVFFDDMLSCAYEQLPIDKECVSVVGVSAGALYGVHLASSRSQHISSFISLSGGIRTDQPLVNSFLRDWDPPARALPTLVLWGGGFDSCALLNFQTASLALEDALESTGAFIVECLHNCGHGVPPIEAPDGESRFASMWEFAVRHPFWLPEGTSPWQAGLPEPVPDWCGVGKGSAIQRQGECGEPGCPL